MKPKISVGTPHPAANGKGRPVRTDNPQRITLYLALDTKRKAHQLAIERRCSIGRLVEHLIESCDPDTCSKTQPRRLGRSH